MIAAALLTLALAGAPAHYRIPILLTQPAMGPAWHQDGQQMPAWLILSKPEGQRPHLVEITMLVETISDEAGICDSPETLYYSYTVKLECFPAPGTAP